MRFNKVFFFNLIFFTTTLYTNYAHALLPENYQSLGDEQKQIILWDNVYKSNNETPLPELAQGGFWAAYEKVKGLFSLAPSFDHQSDEMPEGRKKILHINGSVARVVFIPASGHPFTGIYHTGAIGIARLSLGTTPTDTSFVPGMAIKLLIAAKESVNLHVMNSLEGQKGDWNFFSRAFYNKISHPTDWLLSAIEKIFAWTKNPANELSVAHLSKVTRDGKSVNHPLSPEKILFEPSEAIKDIIEPASRIDFRLSLMDIPVGTIYEVYGELKGVKYHIGSLKLESKLLASEYGDNQLFFQHER